MPQREAPSWEQTKKPGRGGVAEGWRGYLIENNLGSRGNEGLPWGRWKCSVSDFRDSSLGIRSRFGKGERWCLRKKVEAPDLSCCTEYELWASESRSDVAADPASSTVSGGGAAKLGEGQVAQQIDAPSPSGRRRYYAATFPCPLHARHWRYRVMIGLPAKS
jgi:hypothetical protein